MAKINCICYLFTYYNLLILFAHFKLSIKKMRSNCADAIHFLSIFDNNVNFQAGNKMHA